MSNIPENFTEGPPLEQGVIPCDTKLKQRHYDHLIDEGFTPEHIQLMEAAGVVSISKKAALTKGLKVWDNDSQQFQSSSGLLLPFTKTFSQLRCDDPPSRKGKPVKYLTPSKATSEAMLPDGCKVITEGAKDACWNTTV